jgi:predicted nucleotidyltransferase component of viral defense system
MPVDRSRHKSYLQNILIDLYTDKRINSQLGFKGGTALMFFYDLDRFSTDLDFNCLIDEFDPEIINTLLTDNYSELKYSFYNKFHTYFWLINTGQGEVNIKIEIRKKVHTSTLDEYDVKQLQGVSMRVLKTDCMLAHKFCAAVDRQQNRDLYDIWFMLKNGITVNKEIVEKENKKFPNMPFNDFIKEFRVIVQEDLKQRNVLDDIGNLLYTDAQKDKIKATLLPQLLGLIDIIT